MQSLGQALVFCVGVNEGKYQSEHLFVPLHVIAFSGILHCISNDCANSCIAVLP